MCGIFGHYIWGRDISRKEIVDILFCGLKRLEYRGYDSAGLSIESEPFYSNLEDVSPLSPAPIIVKSKGKIAALEAEVAAVSLDLDVEFNRHVGMCPHSIIPANILFFLILSIMPTRRSPACSYLPHPLGYSWRAQCPELSSHHLRSNSSVHCGTQRNYHKLLQTENFSRGGGRGVLY